jgi:hypothetical protein
LTAIGIQKPNHRKKLKAEMALLQIPDGLPDFKPVGRKKNNDLIELNLINILLMALTGNARRMVGSTRTG